MPVNNVSLFGEESESHERGACKRLVSPGCSGPLFSLHPSCGDAMSSSVLCLGSVLLFDAVNQLFGSPGLLIGPQRRAASTGFILPDKITGVSSVLPLGAASAFSLRVRGDCSST